MSITTKHAKDTKRELPPGWKWVRLGEVCERLDYGYTASADFSISSPKFLRITDIQNGQVVWASVPGCAISSSLVAEYELHDGDIVFARTGATTGKSFLIDNPPCSVFASYLIRVRPSALISPAFLYAYFQSDEYWQTIRDGVRGGAQGGFNASMLAGFKIPLPPLPEQQRIAAVLREQMAAVERARKAAEERLEAVKSLPAAFLRQVFPQPGQPLPPGWKWVRLGEVCEFLDYRRKPVSEAERSKRIEGKPKENLYPYYGANGQAGWIDDYLFDEPLILLAEDGGAFGSDEIPIAYKIEGKTWVNNHAHVLRPREGVNLDYCLAAISIRPDLANLATGNTRPKLNQALASNIYIPLPPLPEQQRIAAVLREQMAAVERARKAAEEELETINALPAALLRRAFAGEL